MQAIAQNYTVTYCGENGHGSAVEFKENTKSDMFQLGRSTEPLIDFIVVDTVPGCKVWKIILYIFYDGHVGRTLQEVMGRTFRG